ncbi:MAG: mechanosensitive ion channel family protein, partial [Cyanobacteria bacterium P01_D01_bin.73]
MRELLEEIRATVIRMLGRSVEILPGAIAGIIVLFLTRIAAKAIQRLALKIAQRTLKNRSLHTLVSQISYVTTWILGILSASVLAFPSLNLANIIALLGFSSVAVGFAFQDIFKNFLAGILLLLQEPFRLGDQIIVDGYEGTVEDIALRSTQLRTYQGETIVIPNSMVFTSPVHVLTAQNSRRTDLAIGVDYNTPLASAIETLVTATKGIDGVLSHPNIEVDAVGFGDSAIDLVVRYWTLPDATEVRRTQSRVMLSLKNACDEAGINIPYPIRSLYFFDQQHFNDHQRQPSQLPTVGS